MAIPINIVKARRARAIRTIDLILIEVMMAGLSPEPTIRTLEVRLEETLWGKFKKRADLSISAGLRSLDTKSDRPFGTTDVQKFLDGFEREYDKFPQDVEGSIGQLTTAMYNRSRRLPVPKKVRKAETIGLSLKLVDAEAKKFLKKESMWWIGDHHDVILRDRLTAMTKKSMIEKGLGRKEAAADLQRELRRNMIGGKAPIFAIPRAWRGTDKQYFEALSGNIANRSHTFGTLGSFQEAGIETYEIAAVLDRRTSDICRTMNGKVFTVSQGAAARDSIMATKSPAELKSVAGWMKGGPAGKKFGIKPGVVNNLKQAQAMAGKGMALPPYHFRCRTVIIPGPPLKQVLGPPLKLKPSFRDWKKLLTLTEKQGIDKAVGDYTGSGFKYIKNYQKTGILKQPPDVVRLIEKDIKSFNRVFNETDLHKGTIYRGLNLTKGEFEKFSLSMKEGNTYLTDSFMSTSASKKSAQRFARGSLDKPNSVMMKIRSKSGISFEDMGYVSEEKEILINNNINFKVISKKLTTRKDGSQMMDLLLEEK